MASSNTPRRRFVAEPVETTSRTNRRPPSERSDVSPSPSAGSDSTNSSMAAITRPVIYAEPISYHKKNVEHVENTQTPDDHMSVDGDNVTREKESNNAGSNTEEILTQSPQHKPRREFASQPIDTTARTSKKKQDAERPTSPKRKFAPEPVETSTRSSKKDRAQEQDKSSRPRRKFAVEPIETSTSNNKDKEKKTDGLENGARPKRRFAVELVEINTRSSKEKEEDKPTKPKKKWAVEPVETSTSSSRRKKDDSSSEEHPPQTPSRSSSGGRKFSPELVGTAKASFKKKQPIQSAVPKWLKQEAEDESSYSAPEVPESKFSAANLAKRARAFDLRRHSYCVPHLPMIQSDSSEEDIGPETPSTFSQTPNRNRTSQDRGKRISRQKQHDVDDMRLLREQAVAAYGGQEDNIPFNHYGGDSDDEDHPISVGKLSIHDGADPQFFRRMSQHDFHLVVQDMRQHHDSLERAKRELQEDTAGVSRFSAAALAARHHLGIHHPAGATYGRNHQETHHDRENKDKEDEEFAKMRKAANPPMQGNDIKFPYSMSPRMTRCDPDQAPRPRRRNSEEEEEYDIGQEELWSAHVTPAKANPSAGLWGGLCQKDESQPACLATPLRSGLQTPAFESSNPLESRTPVRGSRTPGTKTPSRRTQPFAGSAFLPLTPPRSKNEKIFDPFTSALDTKLELERQIDAEFYPRVITQIYNYLSLGYPPIARPFDDELSKISRIPISELRKMDRSDSGHMKGHVGLPEHEGEGEEDGDGGVKGCRRWEALRLYVREWARQSSNFAVERTVGMGGNGNAMGTDMWGNHAPVRKGSWGF